MCKHDAGHTQIEKIKSYSVHKCLQGNPPSTELSWGVAGRATCGFVLMLL